MRQWSEDGYRKCSFCDNQIGQCMGMVMAGDFVLVMRGQIHPQQMRERCGSCAARHTTAREGDRGPFPFFWAFLYDEFFRKVSWHLQLRLRRVKHPVMFPTEDSSVSF